MDVAWSSSSWTPGEVFWNPGCHQATLRKFLHVAEEIDFMVWNQRTGQLSGGLTRLAMYSPWPSGAEISLVLGKDTPGAHKPRYG